MYNITLEKNYEKKISIFSRETLFFYALFAAAIFFVYVKTSLALPFFLGVLALAWFSKKNYFWIAFFFLITQWPAKFFAYTATSHLPTVGLGGASISPVDIFTLMLLFKGLLQKEKFPLKLKTPLILLFVYGIFSFFTGAIFHSESMDSIFFFARSFSFLIWIIFFTTVFAKEEDTHKFMLLTLPIVFFILFNQIYFLINGNLLIRSFDPYAVSRTILNSLTGDLRAEIGTGPLVIFVYLEALCLSQAKQKVNRGYLSVIMASCFLSIILSSTRVMFAIFLFIFVGVHAKEAKQLKRFAITGILVAILLFSLTRLGIFSEEYLKNSIFARITQVFDILSGKGKDIDTFSSRLDQLKILWDAISKNLLFGYGFSDISKDYYNSNWGFFNSILMFGLLGFGIIIYLSISYFRMMLHALKAAAKDIYHREQVRILLVGFSGFFLAYLFTIDFFSFAQSWKVAYLMIFLGVSENFARCCIPAQKAVK